MIELTPEIIEQYRFFLQPEGQTAAEVARVAKTFIGVDYSLRPTEIYEREDGTKEGSLDCLRFLLAVAQNCGFLPAEWKLAAMRRLKPKLAPPALILAILTANLDPVWHEVESIGLADIVLLANRDLHPDLTEPHHGAIVTWLYPAPFIGKITHAEDFRRPGQGKVYEQEFDVLTQQRIHSVWRLRGLDG